MRTDFATTNIFLASLPIAPAHNFTKQLYILSLMFDRIYSEKENGIILFLISELCKINGKIAE